MQKTTSVSIGGRAFICDHAAYEVIRTYLDRCKRKLSDNPDSAEILSDIERSIADHLKETIQTEVVSEAQAREVIGAIGEVDSDEPSEHTSPSDDFWGKLRAFGKRMANVEPDKSRGIVFGTSAGIAREFSVDPVWIRAAFVLLTFWQGSGIFLYVIFSILIYNKERTIQTASELIKEAEKSVKSRPYERTLRKLFRGLWLTVRFFVAAVTLLVFMAAAIGLTTVFILLITNPSHLSVVGAYRDWLQVLWIATAGLAVVLPAFIMFIVATRWKRVLKAAGIMAFAWLGIVIVAAATSVVNVPRLRTWAIDHDLHSPYIYVTKLNNKPVDVCFSPNAGCSILTTQSVVTNTICSYPTYDRSKVEGMYGLRYQGIDQDWKLKTKTIPQPVTDKSLCDTISQILADNPYSEVIFTNRPRTDTSMETTGQNGVYTEKPVYQLDYLIADR